MDLFQSTAITNKKTHYDIAAVKLAILFSEEPDIPLQYRKGIKKKSRSETLLMRKFLKTVNIWKDVIETMLEKLDPDVAWRFINLTPTQGLKENNITNHKEFIIFTEYFVLRRDTEKCDDDELGRLAQLYTAFQKTISHGK